MSLVTAAGVSLVNQVSVRDRASSRRPNLVVQQRGGLMDGGATVKNANVYSLDQLIGGECDSSSGRRPRIVFNVPGQQQQGSDE